MEGQRNIWSDEGKKALGQEDISNQAGKREGGEFEREFGK